MLKHKKYRKFLEPSVPGAQRGKGHLESQPQLEGSQGQMVGGWKHQASVLGLYPEGHREPSMGIEQ